MESEPATGKLALVNDAVKRRVDVSYYRSVIDAAKVNVRRARDLSKPELNLVGSAGLYGLDGDFDRAYEEALSGQGDEWSLGFEFRMDLGKNPGESAVRTAEYQLRQAELGFNQALNSIRLEVDTAYSRVLTARQRLASAMKAQELAAENLKTEQTLLDEGKGDLYRVIERQQLLGDATSNVVLTRALLSKSVVALWMASGQLFERYGISEEWINHVVYN